MGEEFYLDGDELNNESQMSIFDDTKLKLIEGMEKKLKECKDNLKYSEHGDFNTNLTITTKYLEAVAGVVELELHKDEIDENKLLEELERLQLSVKELSFNDLKELDKKNKQEEVKHDDSKTDDNDFGF